MHMSNSRTETALEKQPDANLESGSAQRPPPPPRQLCRMKLTRISCISRKTRRNHLRENSLLAIGGAASCKLHCDLPTARPEISGKRNEPALACASVVASWFLSQQRSEAELWLE